MFDFNAESTYGISKYFYASTNRLKYFNCAPAAIGCWPTNVIIITVDFQRTRSMTCAVFSFQMISEIYSFPKKKRKPNIIEQLTRMNCGVVSLTLRLTHPLSIHNSSTHMAKRVCLISRPSLSMLKIVLPFVCAAIWREHRMLYM